jgi:multiple sugar transport system permease protein
VSAAAPPAPAAPAPRDRSAARRRNAWRRRRLVAGLMSPWIVGFTVFFGYPLIASAYFSLTHYDLLATPRWVGLANYKFMLSQDPQIWGAVKNTLWFMAIAVPLQVLFAFGVAGMVTRARAGVGFFRTVFYLPTLAPPVAATLGFTYILNPATGPVNGILSWFGIQGPLWFESAAWAKPSLVLLSLWGIGNTMIIFLAALLDVPRHLYESAALDGANGLRRLVYVTLPTVSPVLLFAVVVGMIDALQYFTQAYVAGSIVGGGAGQASDPANRLGYPEGSTMFFGLLLYQQGFRFFNMGYASAMAMVLLVVAFGVTLIIIRNSRRFVYYAGAGR